MSDANDAGGNNGGDNGAVTFPGWMSSLPDSHKSNERFAQFKEAPAVWDKFDSLLQAEGKAIVIPDEKAKPEEVAAFWNKVGKPEKADGYQITKPADLPETIPYNPEMEAMFRKFAHENNYTKAQAEKAWNWYFSLAKEGHAVTEKQKAEAEAESVRVRDEAVTKLKTEWGTKFDVNKEIATKAWKTFGKGFEDLLEKVIDGVKLGDHPAFMKAFNSIGAKMMDDKATFGEGGGGDGDTPEAKEREQAAKMFPSMNKK
jgi:hypothetical protein